MNTAPATVEDVQLIEPATHFDRTWAFQLGRQECAAFLHAYARTLTYEGKPIAIGGVSPVWAGVGDLWVVMSDEGYQHPTILARHFRQLIQQAREVILAHRLQAAVHTKNKRQMNFLEKLGFEQEGVLRGYYEPDEDYHLYSIVWREAEKREAA